MPKARKAAAAKIAPAAKLKVEYRLLASLKPAKNNARTHSKKQVAQIAASIKQWGFTNPILVDEKGVILAGHGRREANPIAGWRGRGLAAPRH